LLLHFENSKNVKFIIKLDEENAMKHKKYIFFFSFLTLTSVLLAVPVHGDISGGFLNPHSFYNLHGSISRNDAYIWEFTSNTSEVVVLALNSEEYGAFLNLHTSEYTAMLCNGKLSDSGIWRPPYNDHWHFLYINIGYLQTFIIIEDLVQLKYYSKEISPTSLIIGFAGFFIVAGIGGAILGLQKLREKRQVRL